MSKKDDTSNVLTPKEIEELLAKGKLSEEQLKTLKDTITDEHAAKAIEEQIKAYAAVKSDEQKQQEILDEWENSNQQIVDDFYDSTPYEYFEEETTKFTEEGSVHESYQEVEDDDEEETKGKVKGEAEDPELPPLPEDEEIETTEVIESPPQPDTKADPDHRYDGEDNNGGTPGAVLDAPVINYAPQPDGVMPAFGGGKGQGGGGVGDNNQRGTSRRGLPGRDSNLPHGSDLNLPQPSGGADMSTPGESGQDSGGVKSDFDDVDTPQQLVAPHKKGLGNNLPDDVQPESEYGRRYFDDEMSGEGRVPSMNPTRSGNPNIRDMENPNLGDEFTASPDKGYNNFDDNEFDGDDVDGGGDYSEPEDDFNNWDNPHDMGNQLGEGQQAADDDAGGDNENDDDDDSEDDGEGGDGDSGGGGGPKGVKKRNLNNLSEIALMLKRARRIPELKPIMKLGNKKVLAVTIKFTGWNIGLFSTEYWTDTIACFIKIAIALNIRTLDDLVNIKTAILTKKLMGVMGPFAIFVIPFTRAMVVKVKDILVELLNIVAMVIEKIDKKKAAKDRKALKKRQKMIKQRQKQMKKLHKQRSKTSDPTKRRDMASQSSALRKEAKGYQKEAKQLQKNLDDRKAEEKQAEEDAGENIYVDEYGNESVDRKVLTPADIDRLSGGGGNS